MNDTKAEPHQYCGKGLDDFHTAYYSVHGYVSLIVCIFGSIANSLNIAVLTRRDMRSPTNAILTGLAIADLLVMVDYIPYTLNEYIFPQINYSREEQRSYSWACIVFFHSIFSQICHTISIWLTVTLAVWRYIAIAHPQKNRIWCNMKTTKYAILTSYIMCTLLAIPSYLLFSINPEIERLNADGNKLPANFTEQEARNVTLYKLRESTIAQENPMLWKANFWIYSVIIKIIPCIALTILSLRLIGALLEAKRRRKQLMSNTNGLRQLNNHQNAINCGNTIGENNNEKETENLTSKKEQKKAKKGSRLFDKERQTDRTTRMLLAVLLLFLITEFPQGILGLLSACIKDFFQQCYVKLGELSDILALINSAINFILYCSMSRQFRITFKLLFWPRCLNRWLPVAQDDMGNDGGLRENNGHTTTVTQV